jgi:hypothetical protein
LIPVVENIHLGKAKRHLWQVLQQRRSEQIVQMAFKPGILYRRQSV